MKYRLLAVLCIVALIAYPAFAKSDEPFGVKLEKAPQWRMLLESRFEGPDKNVIFAVAERVRLKKREGWLGWTNQLVNLSGVGDCASTAVAKREVLRALGISVEDLRIVVGQDIRATISGKLLVFHAMVAVRYHGQWLVLDNSTLVFHHFVVRPQDILGFEAKYTVK